MVQQLIDQSSKYGIVAEKCPISIGCKFHNGYTVRKLHISELIHDQHLCEYLLMQDKPGFQILSKLVTDYACSLTPDGVISQQTSASGYR